MIDIVPVDSFREDIFRVLPVGYGYSENETFRVLTWRSGKTRREPVVHLLFRETS